jgi:UDP-N-acetylmuramyl tripeptide synthase
MRFNVGGVTVVLDYAHNADGLRGLLRVAERLRLAAVGSGPRAASGPAADVLAGAASDPAADVLAGAAPALGMATASDTNGPAAGLPNTAVATPGRLALLLGHAGNRQNADIEELAAIAAGFKPDLVVIKENEAQLRGREPGEVPQIIRNALLRAGLPESSLPQQPSEVEAARYALDWARPGDVVLLLVHSAAARADVLSMLQAPYDGH